MKFSKLFRQLAVRVHFAGVYIYISFDWPIVDDISSDESDIEKASAFSSPKHPPAQPVQHTRINSVSSTEPEGSEAKKRLSAFASVSSPARKVQPNSTGSQANSHLVVPSQSTVVNTQAKSLHTQPNVVPSEVMQREDEASSPSDSSTLSDSDIYSSLNVSHLAGDNNQPWYEAAPYGKDSDSEHTVQSANVKATSPASVTSTGLKIAVCSKEYYL